MQQQFEQLRLARLFRCRLLCSSVVVKIRVSYVIGFRLENLKSGQNMETN